MEKKKLVILIFINILAFISIYLFINNDFSQKNPVLSKNPSITIFLNQLISNLWVNIFLIFLFISLIILMISFYFYFSKKIKSENSRMILKLTTLVILVFIAFSMLSPRTNTVIYGTKYVKVIYYVTPVNNRNGTVSYNTSPPETVISTSVNVPSPNLVNNTNISYSTVIQTTTITQTTTNETSPAGGGGKAIKLQFNFNFNFGTFINFFRNFLLFVVIFSFLLLILFYIRSSNSKRLLDEGKAKGEEVIDEELLEEKQKIRKEKILAEYLMISGELENIGINPDFSLTPLEFEKESKTVIKNKQFAIITYYYEVVRFSSLPITDDDLERFNKAVHEIYNEIDTFKSLKEI